MEGAQGVQHRSHVLGKGGFKTHRFTCSGMQECKLPGMEYLPAYPLKDILHRPRGKTLPPSFPSVCGVSYHRMTYGRAVDTNLVCTPGRQIDFKEGYTGKRFFDLPSGFCGPTPPALCGHFFPVEGMAAYRQVDNSGRSLHLSMDQGKV